MKHGHSAMIITVSAIVSEGQICLDKFCSSLSSNIRLKR